jgi:hypothetical protein
MLDLSEESNRNWPAFYGTLREFGPHYLRPVYPWVETAIAESEGGTDAFWSEDLMHAIEPGFTSADSDVRYALTVWLKNVQLYFKDYGCEDGRHEAIHMGDVEFLVRLLLAKLLSPNRDSSNV